LVKKRKRRIITYSVALWKGKINILPELYTGSHF
jgi:hypothetical protein